MWNTSCRDTPYSSRRSRSAVLMEHTLGASPHGIEKTIAESPRNIATKLGVRPVTELQTNLLRSSRNLKKLFRPITELRKKLLRLLTKSQKMFRPIITKKLLSLFTNWPKKVSSPHRIQKKCILSHDPYNTIPNLSDMILDFKPLQILQFLADRYF